MYKFFYKIKIGKVFVKSTYPNLFICKIKIGKVMVL